MGKKQAYQALSEHFTRLYRYQHVAAMMNWDKSVMMPSKGVDARIAALAEWDLLIHRTYTDPMLKTWLSEAEHEDLSDLERASVREMQRHWRRANRLPARLVEAMTRATLRCEHAWRTQRGANDWNGFLENFRDVVRLAREEAKCLTVNDCCYDGLLEKYEPGITSAEIACFFTEMKAWLPSLIKKVRARQEEEERVIVPQGPFAVAQQQALGHAIMQRLGFDFAAGRLDVSAHPFCGGVAEDVRLTTRYREDDFIQGLMAIIHETGHALYEQNRPREWITLPIGHARSMGIHESQSLLFEMQMGRDPHFLDYIAPLIQQHLGKDRAFDVANLVKLYHRVKPGFIRVEADELCYAAHVILRFEIERDLIEGNIEADDIPALWDEKMQAYLGIDTRGQYRDGCLQDIHWPAGLFGYFPSYTLGAMTAAQLFACIRKTLPNLNDCLANGHFSAISDWLQQAVWSQGSRWETPELLRRATGEPLNPIYFRTHLETRYLK